MPFGLLKFGLSKAHPGRHQFTPSSTDLKKRYDVIIIGGGNTAHNDAAIRNFRWRAEVNQHLGVRSELVDRQTIQEIASGLNLTEEVRYPVIAGLWHADGATARHDAVAWGFKATPICGKSMAELIAAGATAASH